MINLLPQAEKRKLQKEFWLRYGVLLLFVLFLLEILTSLFVAPSYVIVRNSTNTLAAELANKKGNGIPEEGVTQNDLNVIKGEIVLLKDKGVAEIVPSQVLSMILAQKPTGILISHFTYVHTETGVSAQLSGNAMTTGDLLLFRKLLKDDKEHIKEAKYAQSFINKKTNIDFLLTVDLK